eukprot:2662812-Rhodomonas_salina.2
MLRACRIANYLTGPPQGTSEHFPTATNAAWDSGAQVAGKFGGAAFATAMAIGQSVSTMGLFTNGSSAALTPPNKACCPIPPPTRSSLLSSSNQHVQPRPPLLTGGSWVAQAGQELVLALRHGRADAASATLLLALGAHFCAVGLDPRLRFRHDADGQPRPLSLPLLRRRASADAGAALRCRERRAW